MDRWYSSTIWALWRRPLLSSSWRDCTVAVRVLKLETWLDRSWKFETQPASLSFLDRSLDAGVETMMKIPNWDSMDENRWDELVGWKLGYERKLESCAMPCYLTCSRPGKAALRGRHLVRLSGSRGLESCIEEEPVLRQHPYARASFKSWSHIHSPHANCRLHKTYATLWYRKSRR